MKAQKYKEVQLREEQPKNIREVCISLIIKTAEHYDLDVLYDVACMSDIELLKHVINLNYNFYE